MAVSERTEFEWIHWRRILRLGWHLWLGNEVLIEVEIYLDNWAIVSFWRRSMLCGIGFR